MYFRDAVNHRDTLVYGYDVSATDNVDMAFNETNLKGKPFHSEFEVRSTNQYEFAFHGLSLLLKTQIEKKKCTAPVAPYISAILIKCKKYPLKIYWEKHAFNTSCLNYSLLTDWNPGGWFDAAEGGEQGPFFLKDLDSITLNHVGKNDVVISNDISAADTVRLLYFALSSQTNYGQIVGIEGTPFENVSFFPNPVNDILNISAINGLDLEYANIYDAFGICRITSELNHIRVSSLPDGIYFLHAKYKGIPKILNSKFLLIKKP